MLARAARKALLGEAVTGALPVELITTDRILQRWVVAGGSGLPTHIWDDTRQAKPPPLDDESAIIVERIVNKCPPRTKRLLRAWYLTPSPTKIIARNMGMSPRSLERGWAVCLGFVRFKIEQTKHPTLIRLLNVQPV